MTVKSPGKYFLEAIITGRHGDVGPHNGSVLFRFQFRNKETRDKASVLFIDSVSDRYGAGYLKISSQLLEQLCYTVGEDPAKLKFTGLEKVFRQYIGESFYLTFANTSISGYDRVASIAPAGNRKAKTRAKPNPHFWAFWGKVVDLIGRILSKLVSARRGRSRKLSLRKRIDGV